MTVQTGLTDQTLERMMSEDWCHYVTTGVRSLCGCPPARNARPHDGVALVDGRCVGCGQRKCPDCVRAWFERAGR